jgi:hypothetical protein
MMKSKRKTDNRLIQNVRNAFRLAGMETTCILIDSLGGLGCLVSISPYLQKGSATMATLMGIVSLICAVRAVICSRMLVRPRMAEMRDRIETTNRNQEDVIAAATTEGLRFSDVKDLPPAVAFSVVAGGCCAVAAVGMAVMGGVGLCAGMIGGVLVNVGSIALSLTNIVRTRQNENWRSLDL